MALEVVDQVKGRISHLWIMIDEKVEIKSSPGHEKIHAEIWGSQAWDNRIRGYFYEESGTVTCHGAVSPEILKKIERKFDQEDHCAIYFRGTVSKAMFEAQQSWD